MAIDRMETLAPAPDAEQIEPDPPRTRRWWVVAITVVAIGGVVGWLVSQNGSDAAEGNGAAPLRIRG